MSVSKQIPFEFKAAEKSSFDNLLCTSENAELISFLKLLPENNEQFVYLWGNQGVGKSHSLQALCHLFENSAYVPLKKHKDDGAVILESLHFLDLVCIDDIEEVLLDKLWEESLFKLFNNIKNAGGRLIVSANCPPRQLGCNLPDLQSRFSWGVVFQFHELDDEEKIIILKDFINTFEIAIDDDILDYIFVRSKRDLNSLRELLKKLDTLSRGEKRKLTIPFIKDLMNW